MSSSDKGMLIGNLTVFTRDDVSKSLNPSKETVRRYAKSGKILGIEIGRRWLIP